MKKRLTITAAAALFLLLSSCGDGIEMISSSEQKASSAVLSLNSEPEWEYAAYSEPEVFSSEETSSAEISSAPPSKAQSSKAPAVSAKPVSSVSVSSAPAVIKVKNSGEMRAVWISYLELSFAGKTEKQFRAKIDEMMDNIKNAKLNTVVIHARAFGDAYYKSSIFPWAKTLTGIQGKDPGYDPFGYIIESAHARGIDVHAWFNPFRAGSKQDTFDTLAENNPARKLREDADASNDHWVINTTAELQIAEGGIYYNPGVPEVRKLIIDGVREVLEKYNVDGIHFDDYFYPTTDARFDQIAYKAYCDLTKNNPLSLKEWRQNNVNQLVTGIYSVTKPKNVDFGISPAANVEHNRDNLYADVAYWMNSKSYIDYICPQIYFGFEYVTAKFRFDNMVEVWSKMLKNKDIKLYFGLGQYKAGTYDPQGNTSAAGADEWIKNDDLIKRQVEYSKKDANYSGFMIFSYKYLFPEGYGISVENKLIKQRENLVSILK